VDRRSLSKPAPWAVGIADGAKSNWDFLAPHIDEQVLDFYHATQYLASAASAIWKDEEERERWLDDQCHNLKHKHHAAQRILRDLQQTNDSKMTPGQRKDLQTCITYFSNHLHQMRYARYAEQGIPIGSGVTSSDCVVRECDGPQRGRRSS
jgi:Zn-finger protein